KLKDVQYKLIYKLDVFRELIGLPVKLLLNGLTTGDHVAVWHKKGLAVDITIRGEIDLFEAIKSAWVAGFRGVGIYWNGKAYSFHLDLRGAFSLWKAVKDKPIGTITNTKNGKVTKIETGKWIYTSIYVDPKTEGSI
ncbi:MAG: hypothetical protein KKD77_20330, partial [Gammaproteobacteria bacterium]|nr:hypothetical protein [Gammaproteobacteria bacterium]